MSKGRPGKAAREKARKPRGKHASGHPGKGHPKATVAQRRRAHGVVVAAGGAEIGVTPENPDGVRLNRWLAERGVASRRKCDALIQEGSVEVNGEILMEMGYRVQAGDTVRVEGRPVKEVRRLYYLFYKPKGVLCTDDPRENRTRVSDLVTSLVAGRVYTVGRLDEDSEGLLLLTNDGDFANLIAHPRHGVPKTYLVQVAGHVTAEAVQELRDGVWLADGKVTPERVRISHRTPVYTTVEICMREGRNREIRRLLARVGFKVRNLKRVRIGDLGVKGVKRGGIRPLSREERDDLVAVALRLKAEKAPPAPRRRKSKG
ncbi:MAG: rRNA pseudouridine synthase [Planctomycetes bacterium]|nr:rRNA pseudouridine synthase [Planctomycetota bacterium]MBL7008219.1 rRNA pseudouridine synthase [Planctomycetota bacterium]